MYVFLESPWFGRLMFLLYAPSWVYVVSYIAMTINHYRRLCKFRGHGPSELEMAVLVRDLQKRKRANLDKILKWMPVTVALDVLCRTCCTIWQLLRGRDIQAIEADGSEELIWCAAYKGNLEQVKECLVDNPLLLDMRDKSDMSPLDRAAYQDQRHVLVYLIKNGAKVNAAGVLKMTALHHAASGDALSCADALLKAGADPEIADFDGYTPAHNAIALNETILLKDLIVRWGIDINSTSYRCPLLHWAADKNQVNAVKLLLEMGAAQDLKDKDGLTAMACALNKGHTNVATVLTEDASKNQRDVETYV